MSFKNRCYKIYNKIFKLRNMDFPASLDFKYCFYLYILTKTKQLSFNEKDFFLV